MNTLQFFMSVCVALATVVLPARARSAPGDLYVAEPTGGGTIYRFTPARDRSTFLTGPSQPVELAFDRLGNLFLGNSGAGTIPQPSLIYKISPDASGGIFVTISSSSLLDMAFDGAGNLLVSTGSDIVKIASDGTQSTFASPVEGAAALALDRFGNLYVAINAPGANSIKKFTPDGSSSSAFVTFSGPGDSIAAMAFNVTGDLFVQRGDSILKITPDGNQSVFSTGDSYSALAFDRDGNLFAALNAFGPGDAAIVKFTPDGTKMTFASGPLLPSDLAFEPVTEKVRNISARGLVGTGDDVLIGGFIVGGSALANNAVVVRALGPSLSSAGVGHTLQDPLLELHDASGMLIATNDNWQDTRKDRITASGLAPSDTRESAIFATLPAGNYTAIVRGAGDSTGVAVVEVYSVSK